MNQFKVMIPTVSNFKPAVILIHVFGAFLLENMLQLAVALQPKVIKIGATELLAESWKTIAQNKQKQRRPVEAVSTNIRST